MKTTPRFVEVPSEQLFDFLARNGFVMKSFRNEVIFVRENHNDPRYRVVVYTSVARGCAVARPRGADAIRVCAVFEDGETNYGVAKLPKILRTGSVEKVLDRVRERAREAYAICNRVVRDRYLEKQRRQPGLTRTGEEKRT